MSSTLDNKDLEKVTGGGYTDYLVKPGGRYIKFYIRKIRGSYVCFAKIK